jgi:hypothetical protein
MDTLTLEKANQLSASIKAAEKHIENVQKSRAGSNTSVQYGSQGFPAIELYSDFFCEADFIDLYLMRANAYLNSLKRQLQDL